MSDAGRCRGGVFTLDGGGGHGSGGKSRVIRSGKGKGREEGFYFCLLLNSISAEATSHQFHKTVASPTQLVVSCKGSTYLSPRFTPPTLLFFLFVFLPSL